jgi:PIN domain nuclease of toxin-antitoxin system
MPIVKELKQHKILLDTHVWIWVMTGNPCLQEVFGKSLEMIAKKNGVLVSPISIWEMGMLVEKKWIEIEMDLFVWVDQALDTPGISLAPITPRIAILSSRLPGTLHADPADRLLIATAHEESAVLVTCDEKILHYGHDKFISVHNPTKN